MSEYSEDILEQGSESNEEQDVYFVLLEDGQLVLYKLEEDGSYEKVHGGKSTLTLEGGAEPGLPEGVQRVDETEDDGSEASDEDVEDEVSSEDESEFEEEESEDDESEELEEPTESETAISSEEDSVDEDDSDIDESDAPAEPVYEFATILETTKHGRVGEKQYTYVDKDGDGFYVKVEAEWLTHPSLNRSEVAQARLAEKLIAQGTDADDDLFISEGEGTHGGEGADDFVYTEELGHGVIRDFDASEGDRLVFDTGYGLQRAEDVERFVVDLSYDQEFQTLDISFGEYGSIEIVGIGADQISWNLVDILS